MLEILFSCFVPYLRNRLKILRCNSNVKLSLPEGFNPVCVTLSVVVCACCVAAGVSPRGLAGPWVPCPVHLQGQPCAGCRAAAVLAAGPLLFTDSLHLSPAGHALALVFFNEILVLQ